MIYMPRLSVIVITKNEEQNIAGCLNSVSWADELIIVDDMSTDRTVDICGRYGNASIFKRQMDGFGEQKNFALSKAGGDWVLSIDADEKVPEELAAEIRQKISLDGICGYRLKRKNYIFGKWMLDDKAVNLRLFRRGRGRFSDKKVHESVIVDGETSELENPLEHKSAYCSSLRNYVNGYVKHYSSYTAEDMYAMGRRVTWKNFLFCFLIKPAGIFFQKYFLKNGFKQGWRGFLLSFFAACAYFSSYAKLLRKERINNA